MAAFPAIVSYSHVHDPGRVHGQSGVTQMRMNPQVTWGFMRYVNAAPGYSREAGYFPLWKVMMTSPLGESSGAATPSVTDAPVAVPV